MKMYVDAQEERFFDWIMESTTFIDYLEYENENRNQIRHG